MRQRVGKVGSFEFVGEAGIACAQRLVRVHCFIRTFNPFQLLVHAIYYLIATMSTITVLVGDPISRKVLSDGELRLTVTSEIATQVYSDCIEKFNHMNGTTLQNDDFTFKPDPFILGTANKCWSQIIAPFPLWHAILKPSAQEAVFVSIEDRINAAILKQQDITQSQIKVALAGQQLMNDIALKEAVEPLKRRIEVLEGQQVLTAPLLIRKVVYMSRREVVELVAPGTSHKVENFTVWLAAQSRKHVLKVRSSLKKNCSVLASGVP